MTLGIVQFVESIAVSIPLSYFPFYAQSLGASVALIGLFSSSFMIAQAVLAPRIGGLSDRLGRKRLIVWGLIGDIALGVMTALAPNWIWLLVIRVLNGAVTAVATVPADALLVDLTTEKTRGEAMGFVLAMNMMGRTIGPGFGGFIQWIAQSSGLSLLDSFRIPYFADSFLAFVALLLVFLLIKEPKRPKKIKKPSGNQIANSQARDTKISLSITILLLASLVAGLGIGFLTPVSVLFYNDAFGVSPIEIGLILSIIGLIGFFASWFSGRVSDRVGRKPIVVYGGLVARFFGIAIPFASNINQAALLMAFRRLGYSVYRPALHALRADLMPPHARGKILGWFKTVFNIGSMIGPVMGTWLYSLYRFETLNIGGLVLPGYGFPFFINAAFGIVSSLLILVFVKPRPING